LGYTTSTRGRLAALFGITQLALARCAKRVICVSDQAVRAAEFRDGRSGAVRDAVALRGSTYDWVRGRFSTVILVFPAARRTCGIACRG